MSANNRSTFVATCPSNIALIKYWGKEDTEHQWPANDSVSLTLDRAATTTTAMILPPEQQTDIVYFAGKLLDCQDPIFQRIVTHLDRIRHRCSSPSRLAIESTNSFPTASGIASSASGMGALTIAASAALTNCGSFEALAAKVGLNRNQLAQLARLGSGSACRSLWGGFVRWEKGSSPDKQIVTPIASAAHWALSDIIVMTTDQEKSLGSSDAHHRAWTSPLFSPRLAGINERRQVVETAIANRELAGLGRAIEDEALEMHAVIMTSTPAHTYFNERSLEIMTWLRGERLTKGLKAYFTVDAGPHIHMLCETKNELDLIECLRAKFGDIKIIIDRIGCGPTLHGAS